MGPHQGLKRRHGERIRHPWGDAQVQAITLRPLRMQASARKRIPRKLHMSLTTAVEYFSEAEHMEASRRDPAAVDRDLASATHVVVRVVDGTACG